MMYQRKFFLIMLMGFLNFSSLLFAMQEEQKQRPLARSTAGSRNLESTQTITRRKGQLSPKALEQLRNVKEASTEIDPYEGRYYDNEKKRQTHAKVSCLYLTCLLSGCFWVALKGFEYASQNLQLHQ